MVPNPEHQTSVPNHSTRVTITPFEDIAIALSGGGFRAAAFGLGCLSYLNRVVYQGKPLLQRVQFISSASGGSITNLFYSSRLRHGDSFQVIFEKLFEALEGEKIIREAFNQLRKSIEWEKRPFKGRNLINAFALVYDSPLLFNQDTLSTILNISKVHLREICVNATDFDNGITFRFQNKGLIGNKYLHFKNTEEAKDTAGKLKLADILSASSCFPSGFEPVMFPGDFLYRNSNGEYTALESKEINNAFQTLPNESYVNEVEAENHPAGEAATSLSFGLMDGGITDNQGVSSFLLANERKKTRDRKSNNGKEGYDLFIACDVASHYMNAYELPAENTSSPFGKIKMQQWINLFKYSWIGFVVGLLCFVLDISAMGYIIATLSSVFTIVYLFFLNLMVSKKKEAVKVKSTWGIIWFKYIDTFLRVRTSAIVQMLTSRLKSVGILAGDIYLKQIRRLTFQTLYHHERWSTHALPVFIYELSNINTINREKQLHDFGRVKNMRGEEIKSLMEPSHAMVQCATLAQQMDTTLWFDVHHTEKQTREAIVATAQFTMCYNLIKYLCRLEKRGLWNSDLNNLRESLLKDWLYFKNNDCQFLDTPAKYALSSFK